MAENKEVRCPNLSEGCTKIIESQEDYENHLTVCDFTVIPCPQKCALKVLRGNLLVHLSSECPKRAATCIYCQKKFPEEVIRLHQENCDQRRVTCEYCDVFGFLKKEIEKHHGVCEKKPRPCKMRMFGCTFQGISSEMASHNEDISEHFPLMVQSMMKLKEELEEKSKALDRLKQENLAIKKKLRSLETTQQEQMREMNEMANTESAPLKKSSSMESVLDAVPTKRVLNLETDCQWKITCYGAFKKSPHQNIVWSRDLYTPGEGSYHFAFAAMIPKRRGGIGLYVSLHKGPNDDRLPWPFPLTIKFCILNQRTSTLTELCRFNASSVPENYRACFDRPTSPRNQKVGKINVLSLAELEDPNRGYLLNDTIIFTVAVF